MDGNNVITFNNNCCLPYALNAASTFAGEPFKGTIRNCISFWGTHPDISTDTKKIKGYRIKI